MLKEMRLCQEHARKAGQDAATAATRPAQRSLDAAYGGSQPPSRESAAASEEDPHRWRATSTRQLLLKNFELGYYGGPLNQAEWATEDSLKSAQRGRSRRLRLR
jgi:hypothetical protein